MPTPGAPACSSCKSGGFAPRANIADFGTGLRAGQKRTLHDVPCRGDVFHALHEITTLVNVLENRAYHALTARHKVEQEKTKTHKRGQRTQTLCRKAALAGQAEIQAIAKRL